MTQQTKLDPKLQKYLISIKEQCKPDPQELQRRIEDMKDRHVNYIEILDHGHLLVAQLQEKILNGYRYELGAYSYHSSGSGFVRVRLIKPDSVLQDELKTLEKEAEVQYNKEIESEINGRIEQLMQEAAEETAQKAAQAARKEQEEIRAKLKSFLLS
ncbi:hypothetical protein VAWG006_11510 [Aeromonas enteropelogenes]|uniref:Uncharacterized protein n=1 Tax=Aeromonas sp. 19NY04SH05-1 TaxID=2920537 RepID=A0AAU6TBZ4_9GAMM|nr:hypothetical protein VAWG006_11510 [Aeromonas enteropelogenes]BEE21061.1 hypothetical protein VAWG007_11560 [Aeromonas enteropelogenes]